ncbi:MAG TPA: hypothetical protein VN958_05635 [Chitinophagaceae bacterium]|nr:hypothetical protein [Chitinophagaceae bacterium]
MKRILSTVLIANALIILSLSSCKKENLSPGSTSNTTPTIEYTTTINVVAGRWVKDANGTYANTFQGVISPANTSNRSVKIYLVANGTETQINYYISFMGGELWATNTETDITINYRSKNQSLPFSYLLIKVVIG